MLKILVCLLYSMLIFDEVVNSSVIHRRVKRSFQCGLAQKSAGLIVGGRRFDRGSYPWMSALMEKHDDTEMLDYFCGGVLVSQKKVLTAAHCIHPKNQRRKLLRNILTLLAVHNLENPSESERIKKYPKEIFVHPDWNPYIASYDADISILQFEDNLSIDSLVQPICLWRSDVEPVGTDGVVIGYEMIKDSNNNNKIEKLPSQLEISIVKSNDECIQKNPDFEKSSSERTFCGGTASDETGPCFGDSGHGLFIKQNNIYYLRGLVSSSTLNGSSCDTSKYTIFTNVLKYKQWISKPTEEYQSKFTHIEVFCQERSIKDIDDLEAAKKIENATEIEDDDRYIFIDEPVKSTIDFIIGSESISTTQLTTEESNYSESLFTEALKVTSLTSTTEESNYSENIPTSTETSKVTSTTEDQATSEAITTTKSESTSTLAESIATETTLQATTTESLKSSSESQAKTQDMLTEITTELNIQSSTEKSSSLPSTPQLTHKIKYDDSFCGLMSHSSGLIHSGEFSTRNQFPWMAVVKRYFDNEWMHWGSGSLLTYNKVIVHSGSVSYIDDSGELTSYETQSIKIFLGTTKYDDISEKNAMQVGIHRIVKYPDARSVLPSLIINKISIVTLDRVIPFSEFIRPVCLWPFGDDLSDIVGRDAYAVGYGVDRRGKMTLTRKHVRMTITGEDEACKSSFDEELEYKKETNLFCASGDGINGPCKGDLQLFMKIDAHWYLKGIVSTFNTYTNGSCNMKQPVLYEDIFKFVRWIQHQIM